MVFSIGFHLVFLYGVFLKNSFTIPNTNLQKLHLYTIKQTTYENNNSLLYQNF